MRPEVPTQWAQVGGSHSPVSSFWGSSSSPVPPLSVFWFLFVSWPLCPAALTQNLTHLPCRKRGAHSLGGKGTILPSSTDAPYHVLKISQQGHPASPLPCFQPFGGSPSLQMNISALSQVTQGHMAPTGLSSLPLASLWLQKKM